MMTGYKAHSAITGCGVPYPPWKALTSHQGSGTNPKWQVRGWIGGEELQDLGASLRSR